MSCQYFVYILSCNDGSFYKGMTSNPGKRLRQHLSGQCYSTKNKDPTIVFVQICKDRDEARLLEKYLKSGAGREIIDEIS